MHTLKQFSASFLFVFLLLAHNKLAAQSSHSSPEKVSHKITLGMGHVGHQKTEESGHLKDRVIGAYMLNYDYVLNSHWAIGAHNELMIEDVTIAEGAGEEEHERPVAAKFIGSYKPGKHTSFIFGLGDEISHSKSILLSTIGIDYGVHLKGGWELGGEFSYDLKLHHEDSWILGIGVSKFISKIHH